MANNEKYTILYGRLSQEDDREGESNSIQNQRLILTKYAEERALAIFGFCSMTGSVEQTSTALRGMRSWS